MSEHLRSAEDVARQAISLSGAREISDRNLRAIADLIRARDAEVRADERAKVRYVVFSSDWIETPGDVIAVFATKAEAWAHIEGPGDGYGWSVVEVPAP